MNSFLSKILRRPRIWLDRRYHHVIFWASEKRTHDGFNLYCIDKSQADNFFRVSVEALDMLKKKDPRRYGRAQKYLPNIALVDQGTDHYKASADAFYVHAMASDALSFASRIVHEATHALLNAKKFPYRKETQEQHERICANEQTRFERKCIESDPELSEEEKTDKLDDLKKHLATALQTHWWDQGTVRQRGINAFKKLFHKNYVARVHYDNGQLWEEMTYQSGKLHGLSKKYYRDGSLMWEACYADGVLDGEYKWSEDGITEVCFYQKGSREGKYQRYYDNGTLEQDGFCKNNDYTGEFKFYRKNGSLSCVAHYVKGKREGEYKKFFENGLVEEAGLYRNDFAHGEFKFYRENGFLDCTATYIDDKLEGDSFFYDEKGNLESVKKYKNGLEIE